MGTIPKRAALRQLFVDSLQDPGTAGVPRIKTIRRVAAGLDRFANGLTTFFEQGFDPSSASYNLENSPSKPPEYVFGRIRDRVNYDLDVIHRAFNQRREVGFPLALNQMKQQRLGVADQLAWQALQLINPKLPLTQDETVLTFYQRYLRIRVLPYTSVAPIAIPMTALNDDSDLIAIAHEVGHHAYRRLELAGQESFKALNQLPFGLDRWQEEIFADVYGTIVAGPMILSQFINFSLQMPDHWFIADDGHHPPSALRPYIYLDILKKLQERWNLPLASFSAEEEKWTTKVGQRGYNLHAPITFRPSDLDEAAHTVTLGEARSYIKPQIDKILDYLVPGNQIVEPWLSPNQWAFTVEPNATAWLQGMVAVPDEEAETLQGVFDNYVFDDPDNPSGITTVSNIKQSAMSKPDQTIPVHDWVKILRFGDWAEVGPTGVIIQGM